MKCPTCKDSTLALSERKGIEIDYCPECRGIWLDRGELDKILEATRREAEPRENSAPSPGTHPGQSYGGNSYEKGHYGGKPYKRKKSFLEELFD
jgi:Zn-finger nucleic acid-binding protein